MKIAFDYQAFTIQSYGGISRYYTRLAEHLLSQDEDLRIYAPHHRNRYLDLLPESVVYGRSLNRYPYKTTKLFLLLNNVLARRAIRQWSPDVIHETYYTRRSIAPNDCLKIITVYDMIHELFPHEFPTRDDTTKIKRIAVERADHVICISESTRYDLIKLFNVPESKVSVVHLGFERFVEGKPYTHEVSFAKDKFILYVGARSGYKNFNKLIKAVAASNKLISNFNVIAFGGGKFSRDELLQIKSLGFKENQVVQVGGGDSVLAGLYSKASAFVYPSLYEGFGLPPLEAMAKNCPVISSNTSSMPEVIGDAAEFFNPKSKEEMMVAIENVLSSKERADELIMLGAERLKQFSWRRCAEQTLEIYRNVSNN